jgi:hypothetical protein
MNPLLGIGLVIVVFGVFADALGLGQKTKIIKIAAKPKEKTKEEVKPKPEGTKPAASDSEE